MNSVQSTDSADIATRVIGDTSLRVVELGFGAASLGNLYQPIADEVAREAAQIAWDAGLRLFDTAPHYGQGLSERRLGDVLRAKQGHGYVISTKVGRLLRPAGYAEQRHGFCSPMPFDIEYDYSYDGIMRSYEDSLQRLGLDRVDILYVHDIGRETHGDANNALFKICMDSGFKALDELRSTGQIQAFGLGVNEAQVCEDALAYGDFDCFLLAGRYTLLEQQALESFLPKCLASNTSVIIGGPYNSGILATGVKKTARVPYFNYAPAPSGVVEKVRKIENVCEAYGVPLAAVALQFPLAHPAVASVIPGMGSAARVKKTLELYQTTIPEGLWSDLKGNDLLQQSAPTPAHVK